ncbi:MAG: hypothetical protein E7361_03030 [Clostridiales bacterium]|nr:hypothetical protein [Clostridiales bacterium]
MHETLFHSHTHAICGTYTCVRCGFKIYKNDHELLPLCPNCKHYEFTKN